MDVTSPDDSSKVGLSGDAADPCKYTDAFVKLLYLEISYNLMLPRRCGSVCAFFFLVATSFRDVFWVMHVWRLLSGFFDVHCICSLSLN